MERLHPLTPEQRRLKRNIYLVMGGLMAGTIAVAAILGGAGLLVVVAVLAGLVLVDALLTPWLRYRRSKRRPGPS